MSYLSSNDTPKRPILKMGALLFGLLGPGAAFADWIPPACCPERDCTSVEGAEVEEVRGGYRIDGVPGIVAHDDPRIQVSLDGQWHLCVRTAARPDMDATAMHRAAVRRDLKCLFVPLTG